MTRRLGLSALALAVALPASAQKSPASAGVDTVIRFDVPARTWTWPYLSAHVGLSCHGTSVVIGTSTAPDSAAQAKHYCAGALIQMRNSTLTLHGARGVIHVRLLARAVAGRAGAVPDSSRVPRR